MYFDKWKPVMWLVPLDPHLKPTIKNVTKSIGVVRTWESGNECSMAALIPVEHTVALSPLANSQCWKPRCCLGTSCFNSKQCFRDLLGGYSSSAEGRVLEAKTLSCPQIEGETGQPTLRKQAMSCPRSRCLLGSLICGRNLSSYMTGSSIETKKN
jgi:hypothetical protein